MTSLSMLRRKAKARPAGQGSNLSAKLSFLDVIVDACQHSMRYTLIAESEGVTYTVMIDRGGPFNATGGGLTGSAALAMAASLRKGSYTVTEGWPVEQPLYQLGLDAALQNPSPGTRTETHKLPPARGVDAIRNAAWSTQPTNPAPASEDGDPFVNPARSWLVAEAPMPIETPTPYEAARLPDPSPATTNGRATVEFPHTPWMPGHAALQAAPASEPGVVDQSEVVAESEYAPEPAADAATAEPAEVARYVAIPEPTEATVEVMAEPAEIAQSEPAYDVDESARWLRVAASDTAMDVDAAAPAEPGISRRQGRIKHGITQFLVWTVQVEDETDRHTLGQALTLVGRALRSAFAVGVDPIEREVFKRWHRIRYDWRRSGEAAARQRNRPPRKPATKPR